MHSTSTIHIGFDHLGGSTIGKAMPGGWIVLNSDNEFIQKYATHNEGLRDCIITIILNHPDAEQDLERIGTILAVSNGDPYEALFASIDCCPCREIAAEKIDEQKYREAIDAHIRN